MNTNIEIIEDNTGGITVQETDTRLVAYFEDKHDAKDSLKDLLLGGSLSGWDTSGSGYYITDDEYNEHSQSGGYTSWSEDDVKEFVG
jgi:hypothetical protein